MQRSDEEPAITIGIPVTTEIREFELAVRSIFAQTAQNWELIIALDGASERVRQVAQSITDPRVRVLDDRQRRGLPHRLNEIAQAANAPLIARMDADDVMLPKRIERQLEVFAAHPEVHVVASRALVLNEDDRVLGMYREPMAPQRLEDFSKSGIFTHPTLAFSREWALTYPYSDAWVRTEDKEVWARAAPNTNFYKIEQPLLAYRVPTVLSVRKQGVTSHYDRKLVWERGAGLGLSKFAILAYLAKSLVKQLVFALAVSTGQSFRIQARKTEAAHDTGVNQVIAAVRRTRVPGWDSPEDYSE